MQLPRTMKTYQLSFTPAQSETRPWAQAGVLKASPGKELGAMTDILGGN